MKKEDLDALETRGMWAEKEPPEPEPRKFLIVAHPGPALFSRAREIAETSRLWRSRQRARSYAYRVSGIPLPPELEGQLRAPHASVSVAQLTGELQGHEWRPGEIARAHGGTLLIADGPEWTVRALEVIECAWRERQLQLFSSIPTEIAGLGMDRAGGNRLVIPTEFDLVVTMTPCPCGFRGHPREACRCTDKRVGQWFDRVAQIAEGAERIDL